MGETDVMRGQGGTGPEDFMVSAHSLLDNLPAMAYSKHMEDGRYLACNQLFATFANKRSPKDVVGLTAHDIFDEETADRFERDDRVAMSMDEPYSFFEDASDASGRPCHLKTYKLTFVGERGRLCILGLSMDVAEVKREQEQHELTKAAYEDVVSTSAIYESVVRALSQEYFDLYYVNVETDEYVEYGSRTERGQRTSERRGTDFFEECRKNAADIVYGEDLERVLEALEKSKLLAEVNKHGFYVYYYRLIIDGAPTYVCLKATRAPGDDRHVVIGISNIDSQMRDRKAAQRAVEDRRSYLRLSALAGNLVVLYYVDPESCEYTEFSTSSGFETLGIAKKGTDFFRLSYKNGIGTIHPDDLELFRTQVTRENVLATIAQDGMFVLDYRLVSENLPTYVRLRAALVEEDGKALLVVGLLDEDARVKQEHEYVRNLSAARKQAVVDPLTGVGNKHAYVECEERIDAAIARGEQAPFAVAVCDVNDLKTANDRYGHKEGDLCIKRASARICEVFSHSAVYRVGGDEFVAILFGEDYEHRAQLLNSITALPEGDAQVEPGESLAAGMAEYKSERHSSLLSVFDEADRAMYQRKQLMKTSGALEGDEPEVELESESIPVINARKHILIAEDVGMQRDMLGELLKDEYDISYAFDGVDALEKLRSHKGEIDLLLLDLYMPKLSGREVVAQMQIDDDLMGVPVIFLTVEQGAELDCLRIGAMDFISKPYPDIEIVKARIAKCIELSEGRDLIRHTERDRLTGLLNKEYFFRYVERLDRIHRHDNMDAIACDINNLHAINKRYGREFGDHVLRCVGVGIRRLARKTGGIACREGGDTFLLYCPHRQDYEQLIRALDADLQGERKLAGRTGLKFGVLNEAQEEPDVEERFVRAKEAADATQDDSGTLIGVYQYDVQDA